MKPKEHIRTKSTIISVLFLGLIYFTAIQPAQAQIFEKIKKKVQEVNEVVDEVKEIKEVVQQAEPANKKDKSLSNKKNEPINAPPQTSEEKKVQITTKFGNEFDVKIEKFGKLEKMNPEYLISPDGAHAAVPGLKGSRPIILVDGKASPTFDEVSFQSFAFSPTGGHYAYVGRRGNDCYLVLDGKERKLIGCGKVKLGIGEFLFHFNEDGSHLAYKKLPKNPKIYRDNPGIMVIDGQDGPLVHFGYKPRLFVRGDNVIYSADGYPGSPGGTKKEPARVYVNNEPGPAFDKVSWLIVSDDGEHYAYVGTGEDNRERVVIDGKPGPDYGKITKLFMHKASGAVFYTAHQEGDAYNFEGTPKFVFGDQVFSGTDGFHFGSSPIQIYSSTKYKPSKLVINANRMDRNGGIAISPDGKRIAFAVIKSNGPGPRKRSVILDGKLGMAYDKIHSLQFTGDGSSLIYIGVSNYKEFLVINGNESEAHPISRLTTSPRGHAYAFQEWVDNSYLWHVNGKPVGPMKGQKEDFLVFSPDGNRYAFGSGTTLAYFIEVDGKRFNQELGNFRGITQEMPTGRNRKYVFDPFIFSQDGNRLAYVVKVGKPGHKDSALIVDGKQVVTAKVRSGFTYPTFSRDGKHFAFLMVTQVLYEQPKYTVYIDGKAGPVVARKLIADPDVVSFIDNNTLRVLGILDEELVMYTISF